MRDKKYTVYAKRDNGIITTIYTYKTEQEAVEAIQRFRDIYKNTDIKFVKIWFEKAKGAAI